MFAFEIKPSKPISPIFKEASLRMEYAIAKASNSVAFDVRKKEQEEMKRVLDRPKPQTIRNMRVLMAKKNDVVKRTTAKIIFDQIFDNTGDEYMVKNITGGRRNMKKSEKRMGAFFAPTRHADIDRYGNIKGSQITKVLSQLGRFETEAGAKQNITKRSARSKKERFYAIPKVGVFSRQRGQASKKIFNFIKQPRYKPLLFFYWIAEKEVEKKYPKQLAYWFDRSFKTNKFFKY